MTPATLRQGKSLTIRAVLVFLAAVILLAIIVICFKTYDRYTKTRGELRELNTSMAVLRSQYDELQAKSDELEKKISFQKSSDSEESVVYSLKTGDHVRQPSNPYENVGTDTLFLDLSIKNTSTRQGFISPSEIKLKDSQNHTYTAFGGYPTPYPGGMQKLDAQTIKPGETITGTLIYTIPTGSNDFTLFYGDLEVAVDAQ